jgi:hypothetical protein
MSNAVEKRKLYDECLITVNAKKAKIEADMAREMTLSNFNSQIDVLTSPPNE